MEERIAALELALREILMILGPTSCRCHGLQAEVELAIEVARAGLGGAGEGA